MVGSATIFTANDVTNVDVSTHPFPVIRLKGPLDYVNQTQTIHW